MSVVRNVMIWDANRNRAEYGDIVTDDVGLISGIVPPGEGRGEILYDGKGKCMAIPGLMNAHTHVSMTLLRGLGEELPLMEWLREKIFPAEERLDALDIRAGADLAMLEMISGGVTGFADMYYFMPEVARSVIESGVRAALCRGLIGGDPVRLAENLALADEFDGAHGRLTVQLGPHSPYTVPLEALKEIGDAARERNLGIHFHWLETKGELEIFRNEYRVEPIDYLAEAGLLDARELILAHSVWFPEEGLDRAERDNVTLVHCPKSNLKLGSGYAPVKEFLSKGIRVALGTDGAASNNRLDVWDEMRAAALMHKGYHLDPTIITAREVLTMATVNGARAMGFRNVGLIEKNYAADIAVIDMDDPRYVGCDETNAHMFAVYAGSSRDVRATIASGRLIYRDGEFLTLDREKIMSAARERRGRLTAA